MPGHDSQQRGRRVCVTTMVEPGRFREARDDLESRFVLRSEEIETLCPSELPRVVITHTRPEPMTGVLRRIDGGPDRLRVLGYRNRGGTLGCWRHAVRERLHLGAHCMHDRPTPRGVA